MVNNEHKLLGYYNYTVILTYIGMLAGLYGIVCAFEDMQVRSMICLMAAGLCDMFDGAIASTMKRKESEKCFGIQIDSLSDLIAFGILPAAFVYSLNRNQIVVLIVCGLFVLSGLIRLAYFNVDEQERQKNSTGSRKVYYGLPITMAALLVPFVYSIINLVGGTNHITLVVLLVVMGILFLLPIPVEKAGKKGKVIMLLCGLVDIVLVILVFTR